MPLHPIFVHFPIALIVVAFFADLVGFGRRKPVALAVGWTCLLLGFLGAAVSVATGISDMDRASLLPHTDELVDVHMKLGIVLAVVLLGLTLWRGWLARAGAGRSASPFLVCFAVVLGLLAFQGWYGGELAYSQGAGVAAAGQGMRPAAAAKARLEPVAHAIEKIPGFGADEAGHHGHGQQAAE